MLWTFPSNPPAYVFAEDKVGDDQKLILDAVYRDAFESDPQAVVQASQIRAFAAPLLLALVLHVLTSKLSELARHAPGSSLGTADLSQIKAGLQRLRDRAAATADGDRTAYIGAAVDETARILRMFRGVAGAGRYEAIGSTILSQISADPHNATSGLPEFATALGLLGLGEADGYWTVSRADPVAPESGAATVTNGKGPQRVFFVANQEAALKLDGVISDSEPDAVVVCSTRVTPRRVRSPHRSLPGGTTPTRWVGVRALLEEAPNLAELRRRFREEAVL